MTQNSNQQHNDEIHLNIKAWDSKPVVRKEYLKFFNKVDNQRSHLSKLENHKVIEIGSGMGRLKDVIPALVTTDIFSNPWIDVACSAYETPFDDNSVGDIILIDVFHHLERPFAFFNEAHRILKPQGRVILLDPYISLTSWFVYQLAHHEPIGKKSDINLHSSSPENTSYFAAQGMASQIFFNNDSPLSNIPLKVVNKERWACWSYFLSGGFSKPALYPKSLSGFLNSVDRYCSLLPKIFAGRCLVTLEKSAHL